MARLLPRPRLFCVFLTFAPWLLGASVQCNVAAVHPVQPAEQAFLQADYERAAALYHEALKPQPNDPELIAGLAEVLLQQQKIGEAQELMQKALAASPKSVALQTEMAEVQYRAGEPWLAAKSATAALTVDPCYPRVHLLLMRVLRLNSMHASAFDELRTAHSLDPHDPRIQRYWINTLPLKQRIAQMEAYLASGTGADAEELRRMRLYLEDLEKRANEPRKPCRLISDSTNTSIPFASLLRNATHIRAFGLEVKLNDRAVRLEIDTGASGLLIGRAAAERAGLTAFSKTEMGGVGSQGHKQGYVAFADSIKIGALEFHDCAVTVIDAKNVVNSDGLIGMDVFSNLLVTLDYPMRKLALGPLPQRPEDALPAKPSLETDEGDDPQEEHSGEEAAPKEAGKAALPPRGPRNRYVAPEMKDWTPVYRVGHQLMLPAVLNKTTQKLFILDTGAFSTTISSETAREIGKLHTAEHMTIRGISGKVDKVYYADNVTFYFANLSQKADEAYAFDTSNISKHVGLDVSGFIGFTTLNQLTIHIDYRDGLVKFEYNPNRGYH